MIVCCLLITSVVCGVQTPTLWELGSQNSRSPVMQLAQPSRIRQCKGVEEELSKLPLPLSETDKTLSALQTRILVSSEADTMCLPSGENATEKTPSVCPSKGSPITAPVSASHSRRVKSSEPDTMCLPLGENATD
ncbi:hypothetical protein C8R44DRAFT_768119 [Mycena epipterygia]|nr:hypothetical protein C8R44DRAFT_768119 [Mycena epipterygia]